MKATSNNGCFLSRFVYDFYSLLRKVSHSQRIHLETLSENDLEIFDTVLLAPFATRSSERLLHNGCLTLLDLEYATFDCVRYNEVRNVDSLILAETVHTIDG